MSGAVLCNVASTTCGATRVPPPPLPESLHFTVGGIQYIRKPQRRSPIPPPTNQWWYPSTGACTPNPLHLTPPPPPPPYPIYPTEGREPVNTIQITIVQGDKRTCLCLPPVSVTTHCTLCNRHTHTHFMCSTYTHACMYKLYCFHYIVLESPL